MARFQEFVNKLNKPKNYLLLANIVLVFFLILLFNLRVLPIKNLSDFIFYTIIYLAFALYRPGWSFLFFVGTIMLENINLAPKEIGIMVRPHQFIGGLTILAVLIKLAVGRLGFKLPRWNRYDLLFVIFAAAGFLSSLFALDRGTSLKQSIIAASFVALYFLTRIFIQSIGDLKRIAPFFLSSSLVVVLYGLWQNFRFTLGINPFEVMPGRPNSTFTEPDWLGVFLVLLLAVIYAVLRARSDTTANPQDSPLRSDHYFNSIFLYSLLTACYMLLIISVSRSAWLGAFVVTFAYLFIILTNLKFRPKNWDWKFVLRNALGILGALLAAMALIYIFNLTNFQLFNRAQSTGTGLQEITISCTQKVTLPEKIESAIELGQYGCKHINLEDINQEKAKGNFVTEIARTDPNVSIRSQIYQKSWSEIKQHPLFGIGWGNIGQILGTDANGATLNSSNIFLEVWLGSGILGITAFVLIWIFIILKSIAHFIYENDPEHKSLGLFLFLGSLALIIPNLFNAGIFIGVLWLFFGIINVEK